MSGLLDVQLESFHRFRERLPELIREFSPVSASGLTLELACGDFPVEWKDPEFAPEEAVRSGESWTGRLYVETRLAKPSGEVVGQTVLLGNYPVMTPRGTFIINGVERVIVSQLSRSPGVYAQAHVDPATGRGVARVTVMPERGVWVDLELDARGSLWARLDRSRRVALSHFLSAVWGMSEEDLAGLLGPELDPGPWDGEEKAVLDVYSALKPGESAPLQLARWTVEDLFRPPRYFLGAPGRYVLERNLSFASRLPGTTLAEDVRDPAGTLLARAGDTVTFSLARLLEEAGVERVHVAGPSGPVCVLRPVPSAPGEMGLRAADILACVSYLVCAGAGVQGSDDVDHLGNRRVRLPGELLEAQFRAGLARMVRDAAQRMTMCDPASAEPHSLLNPILLEAAVMNFFVSSQLVQRLESTNVLSEVTHRRRLTAVGPGGLSRDRAGLEVRDVHHTHYGRICPIETPEGKSVGLVLSLAVGARVNPLGFLEAPYLRVERGRVVPGPPVYLDAVDEDRAVVAGPESVGPDGVIQGPRVVARHQGKIVTVEPEKVEYVDAFPGQIFSVSASLVPFIEHDDANRAVMGCNMQRQAVPLLRAEAPLVGTGFESEIARQSGAVVVSPGDGVVVRADSREVAVALDSGGTVVFALAGFERSGEGTLVRQRPRVRRGQRVRAGAVLADGASTSGGELALGRNVLVAFMPWQGYNFEDAIVISEELVEDDVYTSIHIEEYECVTRDTVLGPEEITRDIPGVSEDALAMLDERGIVCIGARVGPGDILVGKVTPRAEDALTPEERLLRAIFGEKAREVKDTSLRMPHGASGVVVDVRVYDATRRDPVPDGVRQRVVVTVAEKRKIKVGDKLANRHGNKGVIALIAPKEDMPFLPDGTPVQVVLNPLGVPSRMNLGQVLETHLGWAARALGLRFRVPPFVGMGEEEIRELLERAGLPPSGKVVLRDGRTGEPFANPVCVGVMYVMKLEHMVDDKVHARSTGPYSLVTQQPVGGRAHFGGQRFGEMEVWALEAYGAAYTLQEMLTYKSDDIRGRQRTFDNIVLRGDPAPEPGFPASFQQLLAELRGLCLDVKLERSERDGQS